MVIGQEEKATLRIRVIPKKAIALAFSAIRAVLTQAATNEFAGDFRLGGMNFS